MQRRAMLFAFAESVWGATWWEKRLECRGRGYRTYLDIATLLSSPGRKSAMGTNDATPPLSRAGREIKDYLS